ncbi:MAG: PepSY-like domain-containing protein [Saprospiraceae bacterium]|uniref:PepSY-like domain-containing protein n=1 Tax=Candidatus Opimibacter skivensis TaxID=2982028 RepID=A0A9D7XRH7_9BACT|nr:PepSY-like domain-containing protein [Candidatus Opimibacter skivensis]
MKHLIFAVVIGLTSTAAFAQTKEKEDEKSEMKSAKQPVVPQVVLQAFAKEYPGTKATWDAEDGGFEAMFTVNGVESSANYSKTGVRESSEVEINVTDLPAAVTSYVKANYAAYKLTEAAKMTDAKNVVTYEAEVKKDGKSMDLIFDSTGKFIKQEKGE